MAKNLFTQTILDKIFETKSKNPVNLDRTRKIWLSSYASYLTTIAIF